jgi:DNA topoisomerase VI subunit A
MHPQRPRDSSSDKAARDIYYRDPLLYKQQATVDRYVDDIAYSCRATRKDLNVVSSPL